MEILIGFDGNYRFLIPGDDRLVIGTRTEFSHPDHKEMAEAMGLELPKVRGGYVEIWDDGERMSYCGESMTVPSASEAEFEVAREGRIVLFEDSIK